MDKAGTSMDNYANGKIFPAFKQASDGRILQALLRNDFRAFVHKVFVTLAPCRPDNFLSVALWLGDFKSWSAPDPVAGRDGPSNGPMDGPPSYRSLRVGWDARISGSEP